MDNSDNLNKYNQLRCAIENGKFYYPAWKHYRSIESNVVCDRCDKTNLISCIGYGDNFDLCLNCVEFITSIIYTENEETFNDVSEMHPTEN